MCGSNTIFLLGFQSQFQTPPASANASVSPLGATVPGFNPGRGAPTLETNHRRPQNKRGIRCKIPLGRRIPAGKTVRLAVEQGSYLESRQFGPDWDLPPTKPRLHAARDPARKTDRKEIPCVFALHWFRPDFSHRTLPAAALWHDSVKRVIIRFTIALPNSPGLPDPGALMMFLVCVWPRCGQWLKERRWLPAWRPELGERAGGGFGLFTLLAGSADCAAPSPAQPGTKPTAGSG
jgi:hypothetical protein